MVGNGLYSTSNSHSTLSRGQHTGYDYQGTVQDNFMLSDEQMANRWPRHFRDPRCFSDHTARQAGDGHFEQSQYYGLFSQRHSLEENPEQEQMNNGSYNTIQRYHWRQEQDPYSTVNMIPNQTTNIASAEQSHLQVFARGDTTSLGRHDNHSSSRNSTVPSHDYSATFGAFCNMRNSQSNDSSSSGQSYGPATPMIHVDCSSDDEFKCNCGEKFGGAPKNARANLKRHIRIFNGSDHYACCYESAGCPYATPRKDNLSTHQKTCRYQRA